MPEHVVRNIQPLLQREKRLLCLAVRDAHDELIKNARCAPDDVFMPTSERVERTRIHGDNHELLLFYLHWAAWLRRPTLPHSPRDWLYQNRERALFLIFATQQMIADRARLAFTHDCPAGERIDACQIQ